MYLFERVMNSYQVTQINRNFINRLKDKGKEWLEREIEVSEKEVKNDNTSYILALKKAFNELKASTQKH